jgi:hypothetical protein
VTIVRTRVLPFATVGNAIPAEHALLEQSTGERLGALLLPADHGRDRRLASPRIEPELVQTQPDRPGVRPEPVDPFWLLGDDVQGLDARRHGRGGPLVENR